MTDADDDIIDIRDVDSVLERLLAGDAPGPRAPAWYSDVAVLVQAARAPGRPDELAAEADIVRRMHEVRLAARATGDAVTGPQIDGVGLSVPTLAAAGSDVTDPTLAAPGSDVTDLRTYPARHAHDRTYRARHAAARLEASRHPAVRTIGRVVAMKAAAVTTAAVIGVAAAAAATTGIVATVVVPALSGDEPQTPAPAPVTTEHPRRPGATGGPDDRRDGSAGMLPQPICPLLPACAPQPPAGPAPATRSTPPTSTATGTTVPGDGTTASESTTTTAAPEPATTVPPTTIPEPTTTTTVPPDPGPVTPMSLPDDGPSDASSGATAEWVSPPASDVTLPDAPDARDARDATTRDGSTSDAVDSDASDATPEP